MLVVDDDSQQRELLLALVERLGCEGVAAPGGFLALMHLARRHYDAVVMDCQMPGLDGCETTRRIREREVDGRTPIIAVTAAPSPDLQARCAAVGMDAFLAKPIDAHALATALSRWLDVPEVAACGAPTEALLDRAVFQSMQEVGLVDRLYPAFVAVLRRGALELGEAMAARRYAVAGPLAHRLRGSSAQLGAARIARVLGILDDALDDGEHERAHEAMGEVEALALATCAAIEGLLAARGDPAE